MQFLMCAVEGSKIRMAASGDTFLSTFKIIEKMVNPHWNHFIETLFTAERSHLDDVMMVYCKFVTELTLKIPNMRYIQ